MSIKVVFFSIKLDHTKLIKIIQTVHHHFSKKEPLQMVAHDQKSIKFVDDLLWKHPKESFLPHIVTEVSVKDLIVITTKKQSLNGSFHFFNLLPTPLEIMDEATIIYDFDDSTTKEKKKISLAKYHFYKEKNYRIETS